MISSTNGIPVNSPDGYDELVYSDVHISDSGEYVHAAPWSVDESGQHERVARLHQPEPGRRVGVLRVQPRRRRGAGRRRPPTAGARRSRGHGLGHPVAAMDARGRTYPHARTEARAVNATDVVRRALLDAATLDALRALGGRGRGVADRFARVGALRRAHRRRSAHLPHRERVGVSCRDRRARRRAVARLRGRRDRRARHRVQGQAELQAARRRGLQPAPGQGRVPRRRARDVDPRRDRRLQRRVGLPVDRGRRRRGPRRSTIAVWCAPTPPSALDWSVGRARGRRRGVHRRSRAALQRDEPRRPRRAACSSRATRRRASSYTREHYYAQRGERMRARDRARRAVPHQHARRFRRRRGRDRGRDRPLHSP